MFFCFFRNVRNFSIHKKQANLNLLSRCRRPVVLETWVSTSAVQNCALRLGFFVCFGIAVALIAALRVRCFKPMDIAGKHYFESVALSLLVRTRREGTWTKIFGICLFQFCRTLLNQALSMHPFKRELTFSYEPPPPKKKRTPVNRCKALSQLLFETWSCNKLARRLCPGRLACLRRLVCMASCGRHVLDRLNEDSTRDREPGKTCGKCGAMKQVCQGEFTLII